ncbi:MAG: flagellar type III secretion system protein FlhB [Leptospiraceae bacterium]|nr:flagellar type III secretion system protein FlhB [Leptospiraceae bacterium]
MAEIEKLYFIDLQLFAAEDEGRTEEGSERRRKEEKDKGNVPRSTELPAALVLLATIVTVFFLGGYFFKKSAYLFLKAFEGIPSYTRFGTEEVKQIFTSAATEIIYILFPVFLVAFVIAVAGNIIQVGFIFSPRAISFNFSRIAPNFKRVLPSRQTLFNLGKSLLKVLVVAWISYVIISLDFYNILLSGEFGIKQAMGLIFRTGLKISIAVGIMFLIVGIVDFFYQRYEFEESLKMTPSEAKQEMKETEGDKSNLNRRRQMVREFIRKGMLQRVPKADVVVVNPTHYSVALQYDPAIHTAPVVTAKGMDEFALIIRRLAKKHNVPIIEDRIQARLMYEEVEVDMEIPAKFFRAVSLIIAKLDKFRRVA